MFTNSTDIRKGMEVYGTLGETIGTVMDVFEAGKEIGPTPVDTETDVSAGYATGLSAEAVQGGLTAGDVPSVGAVANMSGPTASTGAQTAPAPAGTGYLKVEEGGILGLGTKDLYVPFSAITDIRPGETVTLNCSKDECRDLYGNKPGFLAAEEG